MITDEQIKRINELARKSKITSLTEDEKKEQKDVFHEDPIRWRGFRIFFNPC